MTNTRGTDMAKKKENLNCESDFKTHEHTGFFDKLIEFIPARFYLADETERKWFPGLSKSQKARAKKITNSNLKKARRDRLDPYKSALTTVDLLKRKLEKEKRISLKQKLKKKKDDLRRQKLELEKAGIELPEDDSEEEIEVDEEKDDDKSVTYEELRQRLHRKIDELKGGRGGSDRPRSHEKRKKTLPNKRKRDTVSEEKTVADNKAADKGKGKLDVEEAAKDLTFGYVKIDDDEEHGKEKKKRRLSKARELERAMKLEADKKDPEKGDVIAKKHSWKAATSRAAGIKVHDDPKLLKQSIHKEKKRQEKNAEKWKERIEGQQKFKVEKQQKRSGNIADRIEQNKLRKIAKREKKLLRPGFEGRKEGFINEGGK
ncbi:PREDICTED: surfeit locus protein 6-like isoform X2 [Camelina sativa]|uniref:Surfeit locus protein 6-like isoform X1 n=1 Tax=Camelina sativa TaxID=90675 RepID=A0ABM0V871_CAMSA|nr:PREDICTED: surfeit locus protein 6-like isoform X1 [Camelina sativa]XP_010452424.1 PREDICTED: surfeit locus protein 6-like isoform X2 [Camelina sativa]